MSVAGVAATAAALAILVLSVVTVNDESNGMASCWPLEANVSICGMSALSAAVSKYELSGVNHFVL